MVNLPVPLRAASLCDAPLTPLRYGGSVEHVGSRALRVRAAGSLVTVTHAAVGAVPRGVGVATQPDFRRYGLRRGDAVRLDSSSLLTCRDMVIDVGEAAHVSSRLGEPGRAGPGHTAARAAAVLAETLPVANGLLGAAPGMDAGGLPFGLAQARRHLPAVTAALIAGDGDAAARAAVPLLGLGPGLTPSGDDLLIGMAASLQAWRWPGAGAFAAGCARAAEDRTTAVSADLLAHAAHGRFAGCLHTLLHALDDDCPHRTEEACTALLGVGATSGADLLAGVLIGLDVLLRRRPLESEAS